MKKYGWLLLGIWMPAAAQAADAINGRKLHDGNCMRCHDTSVYTKADRSVNTYAALRHRVDLCHGSLGLAWGDSELDDVAAYLDQAFYKFR